MLKQEKKENVWMDGIVITEHFIIRFIERIDASLKLSSLNQELMKDHLNQLMNVREKRTIQFFKKASEVKLPFNKYQIVLKDRKFITIY